MELGKMRLYLVKVFFVWPCWTDWTVVHNADLLEE